MGRECGMHIGFWWGNLKEQWKINVKVDPKETEFVDWTQLA